MKIIYIWLGEIKWGSFVVLLIVFLKKYEIVMIGGIYSSKIVCRILKFVLVYYLYKI